MENVKWGLVGVCVCGDNFSPHCPKLCVGVHGFGSQNLLQD